MALLSALRMAKGKTLAPDLRVTSPITMPEGSMRISLLLFMGELQVNSGSLKDKMMV